VGKERNAEKGANVAIGKSHVKLKQNPHLIVAKTIMKIAQQKLGLRMRVRKIIDVEVEEIATVAMKLKPMFQKPAQALNFL
jgi:hypothetical protein